MKYLILGCNGMAGHMIAKYLIECGHDVTGIARQDSQICKTTIGDVTDKGFLSEALGKESYDIAVNCIGVLNKAVDARPAQGIYINSVLPHLIAELLSEKKTKLIHISTDCVFSGKKGNYTEEDTPDAESLYGRSKAIGEVIDDRNLTIRTSIIGPELKENGIGLFHWFMKQEGEVSGYSKVVWSGVTTLQLAKVIEQLAGNNLTGLYHLVNNESINKYELLGLFNKYCRKGKIRILEKNDIIIDKSLKNSRKDYMIKVPSYEVMIQEMAQWIKQAGALYEQYLI